MTTPGADSASATNAFAPDFLVIGAAKAGTTSIYGLLEQHPDVLMCSDKEPAFFQRDDRYERGVDWYESLWRGDREGKLLGEATTTYTRWPHTSDCAQRIADQCPDARFIYILRHPVERAFSHYKHHMRTGVTMTFAEALEKSDEYVDVSRYLMQLERYLRFYDRDRFLFLRFEDMLADQGAVMTEVERFLGIREWIAGHAEGVWANASGGKHLVRHRAAAAISKLPGGKTLVRNTPRGLRHAVFEAWRKTPWARKIADEAKVPPMAAETRASLLELFREPNAKLAEFLGADLSAWDQ